MLKRLWQFLSRQRFLLFLTILFALLSSGFTLLAPIFLGDAVDLLAGPGRVDFSALLRKLGMLGAVYLGSCFLQWLVPFCANLVANHTVRDLRGTAFTKLNHLPLQYYDTHKHGDIMSRLTNDIDNIAEGLQQSLTQFFTGIITVLGTLVVMFLLSPYIALIVVIITPLSVLIARFVTARSSRMFRAQQKQVGALNAYAEEIISSQKVIKSYGLERSTQKQFAEINAELYQVGQKAQFYSSLVNPTTRFVNHLAYIGVGVAGVYFAAKGLRSGGLAGEMTIGKVASFLAYATQFAKPINEITSVTTQIQAALASAERIFVILDETEESAELAGMPRLDAPNGSVAFRNVSFSYVPSKPLIQNLTQEIAPGSITAIVGPTGAGKTTLVNLLMRFYETDSGSIEIDGTAIRDVTRDSLRTSFAMVLQDTWLFTGSVLDNIAYGKPGASREEVVAAAKQAHAHNFIKRLPQGYDTILSGDGGDLSQGQQQLLTIARAMLIDPPMLILDEATSSVDTRTEQHIQQAFQTMMKDRTSFVIAHRLSTIRHADWILVMKDGDIVEKGTHETLLAADGLYASLYNSQFAV